MAKDLRTFLKEWEARHPEDLVFVDEPVSVKYATAALQHNLEKQGLFPVLVFNRPVTIEGEESRFPLICNLLAGRRRCAEAIGTSSERVATDYLQRVSKRIKPVTLSRANDPSLAHPLSTSGGPGPSLFSMPQQDLFHGDPVKAAILSI